MSESADSGTPLVREAPEFLGFRITLDEELWDYVFVFPIFTEDELKKANRDTVKGKEEGCKLFPNQDEWERKESRFTESPTMTVRDFHKTARELLLEYMSGPSCGFQMETRMSDKRDELFLLIRLPRIEHARKIADLREMKMQVKPEAYPDNECPTSRFRSGEFEPENAKAGIFALPMYLEYRLALQQVYKKFEEKDILRLLRQHLNAFIDEGALTNSEVLKRAFAVHKWQKILELKEAGWANLWPHHYFRCTSDEVLDAVRNYYGEQVAFFFHWLDAYNRGILPLAILSFFLYFRRYFFDERTQHLLAIGFSFAVCVWATLFNNFYQQKANMKNLQWGMTNFVGFTGVRTGFRRDLLGSWRISIIRALHWLFAVAVIIESLAVVTIITRFRRQALHDPSGTSYGMSNHLASKIAKYLITINIKVFAVLFQKVSPLITKCENWRTDSQLRDADIKKQFIVKAFVYYYPFIYIAFVKYYVEGCSRKLSCMAELQDSLQLFFIVMVATFAGLEIIVPFLWTWWKLKQQATPNKTHSYIEIQGKCDPYAGVDNAMMELVLGYGYVTMFSAAFPAMTFISLVSNVVVMKLLAYRLTFLQQRPFPCGQEGLGAWQGILQLLTNMAVVCNVATAVFEMRPIKRFPFTTQLTYFIFGEHALLLLVGIISLAIPAKSLSQHAAEERNSENVDALMSGGAGQERDLELRESEKVQLPFF